MRRVLEYARRLGYTAYTSTLEEAWRVSIRGLSDSLNEAVQKCGFDLDIHCEADISADPAVAFGVQEARVHRTRGIPLAMFLALMKYYRSAYEDVMFERIDDPALAARYRDVAVRFFDRVEIGFCTEWAGLSETDATAELQSKNRELTNEKNRYLTIFESLLEPVIILDTDGHVDNLNEAAALTFGLGDVSGSSYYAPGAHGSRFEPLAEEIEAFMSSGDRERELTLPLQTVEGDRHFMVRLKRFADISGKFRGATLVLADVTERESEERRLESLVAERTKELETSLVELAGANRAKDDFLRGMSHELRTPLNAVLGFSGMLLSGLVGPLDEEQERQVGFIRDAGERLLALVNDLLDLSRLEEGLHEPRVDEFDLVELVERAVELLRPLADSKDVALAVSYGQVIIPMWTDRDTLLQILINLLSNAVRFTDRGAVTIEPAVSRDGFWATVTVRDTGRGIAPEDLERIFERFVRLGDVGDAAPGSGLGLSIASRLAELLGGGIEVESEYGRGSVFTLTVPVRGHEAD
jgi:PAS domain S-box-containing protein